MNPTENKRVVTLKDVAQACGFSINTVSHAINNRDDVNPKTKAAILKAAKELGYIKNNVAGSMRSGLTRTITLIISDISNPLFGIMTKYIDDELAKKGYVIFIINTGGNSISEYNAVVSAIEKSTDGIIICPNQQDTDALKLMKQRGIPFVLMGRRFPNHSMDYVIWNDRQGGMQATEYLINRGHRRILFIGAEPYISSTEERLDGYQSALKEHGIEFDPSLVYTGSLTKKQIKEFIRNALKDKAPFTGIFAFSDFVACDILEVLGEFQDQIKTKIDIVGFDDIRADITFPLNIPSVHTPKKEMAENLVKTILERIEMRGKAQPAHIVLDTTLTIR